MEAILLVVVGVLALGLPHSSSKDRRRFWHPWTENGLAPFLLGAVLLPLIFTSVEASTIKEIDQTLRSLLIIALTAAGLLAGTQLRAAYLHRAGPEFLGKQSAGALLQGLLICVLISGLAYVLTDLLLVEIIGSSLLLAAFGMASSQRPMKSAIGARYRSIIQGHTVSTGWWNLLALLFGAVGVALCIVPAYLDTQQVDHTWMIWLGVPLLLGIGLGRLAVKARSRDEAYVFLIAIIVICGGITVAKGGSPLLGGLLLGAAFVNVSLGRSAMVETVLEDLEQPVVIATGLFAGLCLHIQPQAWDWTWCGLTGLAMLLRIAYRRFRSPSSPSVSTPSERMITSPGATGILLVGSLVLMPHSVGASALVQPFILALFVLTIADEWWGSHSLARMQRPISQSLS